MDLEELKASGLIIFEAISGSRAYGLATEQSDTDIRGVFVQPKEACLGFNPLGQIQNESSDIVFYEIGKFLELVSRNNPSALELLYTPDDCVISEHPSFAKIRSQNWLSKMCADTFLKYAMSQLKKARGLNKKIVNPVDKERKDVMDFCYVLEEGKARSLKPFLNEKGISPNSCGLAALSHVTDGYALYHSERHALRGILAK
ncbi:MAG: nucleotidyltransferase domain-containing protein, partial [Bdellovibrionales bacterium]|nr:nucleotidyltransferase domain-containing protein [Bdellovibrionales bacterium]